MTESNSSGTAVSCCAQKSTSTTSKKADESQDAVQQSVQSYYGKELQSSSDLATDVACCSAKAPPPHIRKLMKNLHDTTLAKYYGCGLCLPDYDLTGATVLDLGCGAGRDVYLASQLVGPSGRVVGVDMTLEQLDAARQLQSYHEEKFGYANTEFHLGYLERLDEVKALKPGSFDLIISNCVINLCTDKAAVLKASNSLLKPGGELYFSDVYASRRVPEALKKNEQLWGECLSGALYWNDFITMSKEAGFADPRLVEDAPVTVQSKKVKEAIVSSGHGAIEFYSATYRLMKIDDLEASREDYGQAVIYKGTIPRAPGGWRLDKYNKMETGRVYPVCGNTFRMLQGSPKLKPHFQFIGDFDHHYGPITGRGVLGMPFDQGGKTSGSPSCCD